MKIKMKIQETNSKVNKDKILIN